MQVKIFLEDLFCSQSYGSLGVLQPVAIGLAPLKAIEESANWLSVTLTVSKF